LWGGGQKNSPRGVVSGNAGGTQGEHQRETATAGGVTSQVGKEKKPIHLEKRVSKGQTRPRREKAREGNCLQGGSERKIWVKKGLRGGGKPSLTNKKRIKKEKKNVS